jgi:hypothetical protein
MLLQTAWRERQDIPDDAQQPPFSRCPTAAAVTDGHAAHHYRHQQLLTGLYAK